MSGTFWDVVLARLVTYRWLLPRHVLLGRKDLALKFLDVQSHKWHWLTLCPISLHKLEFVKLV